MQLQNQTLPEAQSLSDDFVNASRLLELVFPQEESRPCMRTLKYWQSRKMIPFTRIGKRSFYQAAKVKAALVKKFTIESR